MKTHLVEPYSSITGCGIVFIFQKKWTMDKDKVTCIGCKYSEMAKRIPEECAQDVLDIFTRSVEKSFTDFPAIIEFLKTPVRRKKDNKELQKLWASGEKIEI